ncbi:response regulator transcription factor [Haliscomenobacter sp.]|uniref:response regulator transcription factor n=1 Tax=Haliscomenobacter sp. TaxID=2717303 RepID=UPI003364BC9D
MQTPIRVVLFEDSDSFRRSLTKALEVRGIAEVVGAYSNGKDAAKMVTKHEPDLVLMDIEMPEVNGIDALKAIRSTNAQTKVLMLTNIDEDYAVFSSLQAGAEGYALKEWRGEQGLEFALEQVMGDSGAYISPGLAHLIIEYFRRRSNMEYKEGFVMLSPQEKKVLLALSQGSSRKMIAEQLGISTFTVGDHAKKIFRKLEVNSALEAVEAGRKRGILR